MLTGSGGAALLISPGGLTALSQAVMVTHRCSTCSNTAAKMGDLKEAITRENIPEVESGKGNH